jgi:hypothetical protein
VALEGIAAVGEARYYYQFGLPGVSSHNFNCHALNGSRFLYYRRLRRRLWRQCGLGYRIELGSWRGWRLRPSRRAAGCYGDGSNEQESQERGQPVEFPVFLWS